MLEQELIDGMLPDFKKQLDNHDNKFINYLMGEVMKLNKGMDPKKTRELIKQQLENMKG